MRRVDNRISGFTQSPEGPSPEVGDSSTAGRVAKRSLFPDSFASGASTETPSSLDMPSSLASASARPNLFGSDRRAGEIVRRSLFSGPSVVESLPCTEELSTFSDGEELQDLDSLLAKEPAHKKPKISDEQKEFKELCAGLAWLSKIKRNAKQYDLDLIRGSRGSFMQAYRISPESPALIEGLDNRALLVKLFHMGAIERSPYKLQFFMENALDQYNQLLSLKEAYPFIEVPQIYNAATAKEDGYYLQEYIPYPIDTRPWANSSLSFEELDETSQKILVQVRKYMRLMEKEKVLMDLKPENFRTDNAGTISLIDFAEDFDEDIISLSPCLSQAVNLWSAGNQKICDFLKEGTELTYLKKYEVGFQVTVKAPRQDELRG